MDKPSPTLLIGYLLNALEDEERAKLEQLFCERPEVCRELAAIRHRLARLEWARPDIDPPPGLAARTCKFIFDAVRDGVLPAVGRGAAHRRPHSPQGRFCFTPIHDYWRSGGPAWSWLDLAVAACVLIGFLGLLFPALVDWRVRSQTAQCRENLRSAYRGMSDYEAHLAGFSMPAVWQEPATVWGGESQPRIAPPAMAVPRVMCCPTAVNISQRHSQGGVAWENSGESPARDSSMGALQVRGWPVYRIHRMWPLGTASEYAVLMRDPDLSRSSCEIVPPHVRGWNVLFEDGHVVFMPPHPVSLPPPSQSLNTSGFAVQAAALAAAPQ